MKNLKRILALAGVILLVAMYVLCLVFALIDSPAAHTLFLASIACTFLVPVLLYAFFLIAKVVRPSKSPVVDAVIFDVGGVLLNCPWEEGAREMHLSQKAIDVLCTEIVPSALWAQLDLNIRPYEDILSDFCAIAPEYSSEIRYFVAHIYQYICPYSYTNSWLADLKAKGYRLYVLSNWPEKMYQQLKEAGVMDFEKLLDGAVWSFAVRQKKPDPAIYETLSRTYRLEPDRCVFLDDAQANIDAAKEAGFNAFRFTGYEEAKRALASLGVR